MKYTLYKDDKFIMQRKRFHPLRVYLLKALGNEIWSIRNGKRKQQKGFEGKGRKKIKEQNQEIV